MESSAARGVARSAITPAANLLPTNVMHVAHQGGHTLGRYIMTLERTTPFERPFSRKDHFSPGISICPAVKVDLYLLYGKHASFDI